MQVLLRTASTLARQCAEAAQRIEIRPTTRFSVNQPGNLAERLTAAANTTSTAVQDVLELYATRGEIRRLIGNANQDAVHALLVERDVLNTTEKVLSDLIDQSNVTSGSSLGAIERRRRSYIPDESPARTPHNVAEITAALEVVRKRIDTVTTGTVADFIEVPSVPAEQVRALQERLAILRRRRTALSDELAASNLKVNITLPPEVERVLRRHQIIA